MTRILTNYAGTIDVHIHIHPVIINLLQNPYHTYTSLIGKGLFAALTDLGFLLDWHTQNPSCSRHYRKVQDVEVDQFLLYKYHANQRSESSSRRCSDLKDSKSTSFDNGQQVVVQGQEVILFSDTVVGTSRTLFFTLYNPLEVPILVRLVSHLANDVPEGLLHTNHSDCILTEPNSILEGTIASNGQLVLGPLRFAPKELGIFSQYFMLMNNYTGLEPSWCAFLSLFLVLIAGRSIEQPILLGDTKGLIRDVSFLHLGYV